MSDQAIQAGAKKLVDSIEKIYKELKEVWNYLSREKIDKYLASITVKYSEVKTILYGNNPRPFYSVYFPLSLMVNDKPLANLTVGRLFSRRHAFIVTADAGSGKSMLVKHLFNETIREAYGIPFIIELRYLNTNNTHLEAYLDQQIQMHITDSNRIKTRLFESGEFVFFLDGYDEVKKDLKQAVVHAVKNLTEKYPKVKFLISTRPYTNIEMLQNFVLIKIKPLSKTEVSGFIQKQISDAELASKIIQSITETRKTNFSSFLRNPLLLTLYILTYQNSSEVPTKASIFYRRVVDALFIEHDSKTKIGYQRERASRITFDKFEDTMRKFSFVSFFEDRFSFDNEYAASLISKITAKDASCDFKPEELVEDLKLAFSFWIDDSGTLSFAHRSLQEYFCALYIRDLDEANKATIYRKLLEKVRVNDNSDAFNILSILDEVDNSSFLSNYYIPMLTLFKETAQKEQSNLCLIGSFFSTFYKFEETLRVSLLPSGYKFVQLLDKSGMVHELYKLLSSELNKVPDLERHFKAPSGSPKSYLILKHLDADGQKIVNDNPALCTYRERFFEYIASEVRRAEDKIRFEREKKAEILSLI